MESEKLKDQLILLCIHPDRGWVRNRQMVGYVLIAAALYDLVFAGALNISKGRITINEKDTGDRLLNDLLKKIASKNGKRLSWMMSGMHMSLGNFYRDQMKLLEGSHKISSIPLEWLGITWGKRYRVNRRDHLKPLLTSMDRVLIYGRKPELRLRLIIELLGLHGVLASFFPDGELKTRAKRLFKEILKQAFDEHHESLTAIRKELRNALRMNQKTA